MRLLPYRYMAAGIRRINDVERQPACIYFHPWEIDAEQPRIAKGFISKLRTYTGLGGMIKKLNRLVSEFQFAPMTEVYSSDATLETVLLTRTHIPPQPALSYAPVPQRNAASAG